MRRQFYAQIETSRRSCAFPQFEFEKLFTSAEFESKCSGRIFLFLQRHYFSSLHTDGTKFLTDFF